MAALAEAGRRVLALDWPGHGMSGRCVLPAATDTRAHVIGVLDAVLDEPAMLIRPDVEITVGSRS